ncbi:MAG: hypothetical protein AMXMBFR84_40370 [Candidatus Hydrogenedentota bacterium]
MKDLKSRLVFIVVLLGISGIAGFVVFKQSESPTKLFSRPRVAESRIVPQFTPVRLSQDDREAENSLYPGLIAGRVYFIDGSYGAGMALIAYRHESSRMFGDEEQSFFDCQSDADGCFAFDNLPLGTYSVSASKQNFIGMNLARLTAWDPSENVIFVLSPGKSITGHVNSYKGGPVQGARVFPISHDGPSVKPFEQELLATLTDVNGAFRVSGLSPNTWKLRVIADGFAPLSTADIQVGSENVELVLQAGFPLGGIV